MAMEQRVAAGEADLPANVIGLAEIVEPIEDQPPLIGGNGSPAAAVVTVTTVQVAGLGDVPLQCENIGPEPVVKARFGREERRRSDQGGRRCEQQTVPDSGGNEPIDHAYRNIAFGGYGFGVQVFDGNLHGQ